MTHTRKRFDEDPYLARCEATVIVVHPEGIELDETVCYARSGGQAGDTGLVTLSDGRKLALTDTIYADDRRRILHVLEEGATPRVGDRIAVELDWPRRHRLMRLHTCLHLLGALVPAPVTGCSISRFGAHRLRPARIHARQGRSDRPPECADRGRHARHRQQHLARGAGGAARPGAHHRRGAAGRRADPHHRDPGRGPPALWRHPCRQHQRDRPGGGGQDRKEEPQQPARGDPVPLTRPPVAAALIQRAARWP